MSKDLASKFQMSLPYLLTQPTQWFVSVMSVTTLRPFPDFSFLRAVFPTGKTAAARATNL